MSEKTAPAVEIRSRDVWCYNAITILLNTSLQLPCEVTADTLSESYHCMLVSGYNVEFRLEIIICILYLYIVKISNSSQT